MPDDSSSDQSKPIRIAAVFLTQPLGPAKATEQARQFHEENRKTFAKPAEAEQFLRSIHMPASLRWAFQNNGKSGTSSARRFLFHLEFGVPLTAEWDVPTDINSDAVVHNLQGPAGVLRPVAVISDGPRHLDQALRLATVRHPTDRILSAFDYLCLSHDLRHSWFSADRLRMNAMVGFDWTRHPRTAAGLERFLTYIEEVANTADALLINPHWRPQIDNIRPDVFRPQIVGRLENMTEFFNAVCERLDQRLPVEFAHPKSNRQTCRTDRDSLLTAANLVTIERIYARDFAWLNYAPTESFT